MTSAISSGVLDRARCNVGGAPNESAAVRARYTKMTVETIRSMARATYDQSGTLDPALMQPVIDTGAKYGSISHPFPAAELIAPAPVRTP